MKLTKMTLMGLFFSICLLWQFSSFPPSDNIQTVSAKINFAKVSSHGDAG
jgi:hypothetical protein